MNIVARSKHSERPLVPEPPEWKQLSDEQVYRCQVILEEEPAGGFSVYCARLPGVASQGDTEEEALANIKEAIEGAIEAYNDLKEEIPWSDPMIVKGTRTKWVIAHA